MERSHPHHWKFFLLLLIGMTAPALSRAEFGRFDQVFQFSLGGATGANRYTEINAAGINLGLAYRIYPFPSNRLSLGAEVNHTGYKGFESNNSQVPMDVSFYSAGAFLRFDFNPESDYIGYMSAGALALDMTKDLHEPTGTTSTTETRGGYFLALGFDFPLENDSWRMGAEARTTGDSRYFVQAITGKVTISYVWSAE